MDLTLQKYFAFVKTAELGSISRAAQSLHYSQSGVSRMIGALEEEWDVSLLERGKNGTRLTSEGTRLLPLVRDVCREQERLLAEVDSLHGLQSGLIRIGAFASVATHWLPGIIKDFQKSWPNISYELLVGNYTDVQNWILEGRVDCGFLRLPAKPGLKTIFLKRDELAAILPENHRLAASSPLPLSQLCEEPFMLVEQGESSEILEIFERWQLTPRIHFRAWDDYTIMAMAESELGVSILPKLILERCPYRIAIKSLDVPAYRDIAIAFKEGAHISAAVKKFLEHLQNVLQE